MELSRKKMFAAAFFMAMLLSLPGVIARAAEGENQSFAPYRNPALSGFTKTWIYQGEEWNPAGGKSKIFADDQEDGDLTTKIVSEGTVNTAAPGTYTIRYTVTDSDQNTSQIEQEVKVLAQNDTAAKLVQRTLYTLPPADHLTGISFLRGYNHDRQSLGIWLEAEGELRVRLVNSETFHEKLAVHFYNDDSRNESNAEIPANGNFVTLSNTGEADCVPFVLTPKGTTVQPVLEFEWTEQMHEIPYYRYGDSEEAFFAEWEQSAAPFAILEGDAATFLAPEKDRMKIVNSSYTNTPEYRFQSIDEMLDWYASLMRQYDEYVGLDFYADEPYNQNVRAKYFVKADQNGPAGSAAYYTSNLSAYTGDSLSEYLAKSWVVLHEFAHGYEGSIAAQEYNFVETTNNILGYYFQPTYRLETDFGWLLSGSGATKAERLANLEQRALSWRESTSTFNEITRENKEYQVSLYMFVNALDRLGPKETVAHMHGMYRKYYAETGKSRNASDAVVESFSDMGYNMIPYFESYHIVPTVRTMHEILNADQPILYYLRDLIPDDALASEVKDTLGLDGVYSLVMTDDIAYTGYTSNVSFRIDIDDLAQIQNKNIVIKNGKKIVKKIPVTAEEFETELPVGAYEVELPAPNDLTYSYENKCIIAAKGEVEEEQVLTYKKITKDALADDAKLMLYGLGNSLFASVSFDTMGEKLTVRTEAGQPHSVFSDLYATIRVLDTESAEVYKLEMNGTQQLETEEWEINFPIGYKLVVAHREGSSRLRMMSQYADEPRAGFVFSNGETTLVMTERGPMVESWNENKRESVYLSCLNQYSEAVADHIESAYLSDESKYHQEKLVIWNAYQKLSLESQEAYERKWSVFVGGESVSFYQKIPSENLTGFADSEENGEEGKDGPASHAVDGKENTYWHSNWHQAAQAVNLAENKNNTYTILLSEPKNVGKLVYVPRIDDNSNGRILGVNLYYSTTEDGDDFQPLLSAPVSWADNSDEKDVEFDATDARRIRLQVTGTAGSKSNLISAAEFYLYEKVEVLADSTDISLGSLKDAKAESGTMPQIKADGSMELPVGTKLSYNLEGKNFDQFSAQMRVKRGNTDGKTASVQIYGDGTLLYDSEAMASGDANRIAYLDVRGVKNLTIEATGDAELTAILENPKFYLLEDKESVELFVGETARVTANHSMNLSGLGKVSWSSADETVATVDRMGNITAVAAGATTILLQKEGEEEPKAYRVTVANAPVVNPPVVNPPEEDPPQDPNEKGDGTDEKENPNGGDEKNQGETPVVNPPAKMTLKKVKKSGKKVLVQWKKDTQAAGYEIWMKQKGKKGGFKKVKTAAAKKASVKIGKLKKGGKYTFKIRAYCTNAVGEKVYGAFSKQKTIKM